jgi:murein DD-endopeptidase MepM/ murein hydrolase activator NlpD
VVAAAASGLAVHAYYTAVRPLLARNSPPATARAPVAAAAREPGAPNVSAMTDPARSDIDALRQRGLLVPVAGADVHAFADTFTQGRDGRAHEALDIMAPRGTPVLAVDDGRIEKLFTSVRGGLTVYQFDPAGTYCYYYAHLDRYAPGLAEQQEVHRGDRLGDVGSTGNALAEAPHLHFAIFRLLPDKHWWEGAPINPYPLWQPSPPS